MRPRSKPVRLHDAPLMALLQNGGPMYRRFLLVLVAMAPATFARADDCDNASDQRTMSECTDKAFRTSDATLNALYKQIVQRLQDDAATTKLLVSAQRAWVAFRDAECTFSASSTSG